MTTPSWWEFFLLALATFRTWRLVAHDTILDPIRFRIVGLPSSWQEGQPVPGRYRDRVAEFITCPWCMGAWIAILWWAAWQIWEHGTLVAAGLVALSGVMGLLGMIERKLADE